MKKPQVTVYKTIMGKFLPTMYWEKEDGEPGVLSYAISYSKIDTAIAVAKRWSKEEGAEYVESYWCRAFGS